MKRRHNRPNRKLIKRNTTGSERSKREGAWRPKEQKSATQNRRER